MLTDNLAAHINDVAGKHERVGNAIDSDDSRSSTRLRIKDFQQHGLRGHHWFGRFRYHSFAGVGSRYRSRQFAPATTQARQPDSRGPRARWRRRRARWRRRAPDHSCRPAWRRGKPDRGTPWCRSASGICRRRRTLGTAGSVLLAQGRSHRCRRCHRICNRRYGRCLGRRCSRSRHVLVLHGPIAHAGFLGLLPVARQRLERAP